MIKTLSETTRIEVESQHIAGTFLVPRNKVPGVLFVHGWGGSQAYDLKRANGMAGLGCVCLTFDLRGHSETQAQQMKVTREDNLQDVLAAYDCLLSHPSIDTSAIAVVGSSYGGYLAAILTELRPVRWLALHAPALYQDAEWLQPKCELNRDALAAYRSSIRSPTTNRALSACTQFRDDVLLVQSEHDTYIPHSTIMSYRAAFSNTHSMTHRILDGADHGLTNKSAQQAYTSILLSWTTEMVIGARVGAISANP
jgi:pimeloyl-ACP methyl ester carboxylesterase|tara:strand:+ start:18066 stop:18827 length:762 start_codon:yes stop_codon:yes gene_type:complete